MRQSFPPSLGLPPPSTTMFNTPPPVGLGQVKIGPPNAMVPAMGFNPIGVPAVAIPGMPINPAMMNTNPMMGPATWTQYKAPAAASVAPVAGRPMISELAEQRRLYSNLVSADLRDRAADWQEYKTADQRYYYHNKKTDERTWQKPTVVQELDGKCFYISKCNLS